MFHRLAGNDQHPLVAIFDGRQVSLGHAVTAAMFGQGFDDHPEVGFIRLQAENRCAAHAIKRLENHITMLGVKSP